MSTPSEAPAGASPVAVTVVAIQAVKKGVDVVKEDPTRRDELKRMMATIHQIANGTGTGRESGQPGLPDVEFHGAEGAVVASRQRISADGRRVPELVSLGENDAAAAEQAAAALGRNAAEPVPGLEAYGDRSMPTADVDDRTTLLDNQTVQNGLSTGSPTQQRATDSGLGTQQHTGSRVQQTPQDPNRTR